MKKLMIISAILITGFLTIIKAETKIINHSGFEFGFFYSNLSPYGTWIELEAGLVVWRPTIIRRGWAPYRQGRWIWTVDGWYWDSYEPFGHIVFHYGRWYYDDYYGWIWIPDYDWAPAWVEWRYDDDYIGWAPLPPYAVFSINIGIHYTHSYYVPYYHWHYVKYNRFCDPYVYNHYVAPKYKYRIHNRTKVRHNYGYRNGYVVNRGVDIDIIRKRSGQNIRQRDIVKVNDYREVEKYRGKNNDAVRTFVASRDQLTKSRSNDVKIRKENRRSTLDVSKVRIGRESSDYRNHNNVNKERSAIKNNNTGKNDVIINDRNKNSDVKRKDVKIQRNDVNSRTEVKRETKNNNKVDVQRNRNNVQRKEVNTQRNNDPNRRTDIKRENRVNIQQQRKDVQRKESNIRRQDKVEIKKDVKRENSNSRVNVEKQRNEKKTQFKTEQKRNSVQNKTRTEDRKVDRKKSSGNTKDRRR